MIPLFKVFMSPDVKDPLLQTLYSGSITQGPRVEEFETKLSEYFEHPYIVTLNSATSGLTMAIRMMMDEFKESGVSVHDDDEILSVPLTCMATNIPIVANGYTIRWVDVDKQTGLIDCADLEAKLSPKTKIIVFVHWGGYPVDLDAIHAILDKHEARLGFRPKILEDCAHAFLSEYKGKKIGTTGNYAVFSLQAIKHLTTGDGGLLFCPTQSAYERAKLLRWYGIDRNKRNYKGRDLRLEHDVVDWGYKYHMNDINATIGLYNLPSIPNLIKLNRNNAAYYDEHIVNPKIKKVHLNDSIHNSSYWLYTIFVENKAEFIEYMKEKGVMASQVHQRNDVHSCFQSFRTELPNLDSVEQQIVCIPVGWWITNEERDHIVQACNSF